MISAEFKKEDYWRVKWPLLSFVLSLALAGGLLFGLNTLNATAAAELRTARSGLDEARDAVDKIEEEDATIIEYLGRYQRMEQEGIVAPEDRLQFLETLAELRTEFILFPVSQSLGGQTALQLQYAEGRTERGREIVLHTSLVELSWPLLHENDLSRLLLGLVESPGLLQPLTCSLSSSNRVTGFVFLAKHFEAACTLNWYTFQLPPEIEEAEEAER